MEYKNSFVCYESVYRQFERMVQRGKQETATAFIDAVMRYGLYGEKPDDDSEIWDFGFDGIIATISSAKANTIRKSISRKMNYLRCWQAEKRSSR
jgi:hypothetical protein